MIPWCSVNDILSANPARVQFRFWGAQRVYFSGAEYTGKQCDDIASADIRSKVRDEYDAVFAKRSPLYIETEAQLPTGAQISYQMLRLPFADAAGPDVAHVLSVLHAPSGSVTEMRRAFGLQP